MGAEADVNIGDRQLRQNLPHTPELYYVYSI